MSRTSGLRVKDGLVRNRARTRPSGGSLAERPGLKDRLIPAPALGSVGGIAVWMGEFDEAERWLRRAWEVAARHRRRSAVPVAHNHQIPASPSHHVGLQHACVTTTPPCLYTIRIRGRLGATVLSAFPTMVPEVEGSDTVLTGWLADRSAVFGVLAQIEALGLELLELHQVGARPKSPDSGDNRSPDAL